MAVAVALLCASAAAAEGTMPAMAEAERLLDRNMAPLVADAVPHLAWISGRDLAWFVRRSSGRAELIVVDPAQGTARAIADLAHFNAKGAEQSTPVQVVSIESDGDGYRVRISRAGVPSVCRLPGDQCMAAPPSLPEPALASPDGLWRLVSRDGNLWITASDGSGGRALTTDGDPYYGYGKTLDSLPISLPRLKGELKLPPYQTYWSPDGRQILGLRVDERAVPPTPFVELVPPDGSLRPKLYSSRVLLVGDRPAFELYVIDAASGTKRTVALPDGWDVLDMPVGWSADGRRAFAILTTLGQRKIRLAEIDLAKGTLRTVIEESDTSAVLLNSFMYNASNVRIIDGGRRAIWFSQQSGWGHLSLWDVASGRKLRDLTAGKWLVRDIISVDEKSRTLFFTATGREAGRDVYQRGFYRVALDGGPIVPLAIEEGDHAIDGPASGDAALILGSGASGTLSPSRRYFIDSRSTVTSPPVTTLRDARDGRVVFNAGPVDIGAIRAAGWTPPERTTVKAADGRTDLAAVIYRPPNFDSSRRYPVIDAIYGGPQLTTVPSNFSDAVATFNPIGRSSLAALGFIVISVDGRGTPGRSRAFHATGYGNFADPAIDDHVAAVRELATRYPSFDLTRVGIYGHSFGGYVSARAVLRYPEVYKVGVSSAGSHAFGRMYLGMESFLGAPDFGGGRNFRKNDLELARNYEPLENAPLAKNLRGDLLLSYADDDENAQPSQTVHLVDALIKANKRFDLLLLPNRTHDFFRTDSYYQRRLLDYFVTHLKGRPPEK
jgi:dipeptidyl aminopeptidase/acylaminoacyl peptidase